MTDRSPAQPHMTALKLWPEPQPITDAQKGGKLYLMWNVKGKHWFVGYWDIKAEGWSPRGSFGIVAEKVTHYLPMPPNVKS